MFVLGLDGATWHLILPWVKKGYLPTFSKLIKEGSWGYLESTLPAQTSPAWLSISTGLDPGELGVYGFTKVDFKNKKIQFVNSKYIRGKAVWDKLGNKGIKVGVVNVPFTYPPWRVNGIMISGHPASEAWEFTYPHYLKKRLNESGYRIHPLYASSFGFPNVEKGVKEINNIIDKRFRVATNLIKEYDLDFTFMVIFYIDKAEHFLWREKTLKYLLTIYQTVDRNLSQLIKNEENLIIISDHGMTPTLFDFQLNTWLYREGFLKFRKTPLTGIKGISKRGFTRRILLKVYPRALQLLNTTPYLEEVVKKVYPLIAEAMKAQTGISDYMLFNYIDFDESVAFASSQCIYLIDSDDGLKNKIVKKLYEIKDPVYGIKVFKKVIPIEEMYPVRKGEAPSILLEPNKKVSVNNKFSSTMFRYKNKTWIADHEREGIFMFYNKDRRRIFKGKRGIKLSYKHIAKLVFDIFAS